MSAQHPGHSNLQDQGFRFVLRSCPDGYCGTWRHPAEVQTTDIDCTDMTDADFEAKVREVGAK